MTDSKNQLLQSTSPDGLWKLEISGPTVVANRSFYAHFRRKPDYDRGFPFGYPTDPADLNIRWDLPDNVCGVFIKSECYILLPYGARRRRKREHYRVGQGNAFSPEEIAWLCSKDHTQPQKKYSMK